MNANLPVSSGTNESFALALGTPPPTVTVACATSRPSRLSVSGTCVVGKPRAATVTSRSRLLRTNAKSSTRTSSTARSFSAPVPTESGSTGAPSFFSASRASGLSPPRRSTLSAPSVATTIPASGRPPPPDAAPAIAASRSVRAPVERAAAPATSPSASSVVGRDCESKVNASSWNRLASADSSAAFANGRAASSARDGPPGDAGSFIDREVSTSSATRARTLLVARSSRPGSSTSASASAADSALSASNTARRDARCSRRRPHPASATEASASAAHSASAQPGSGESAVKRQSLNCAGTR